MEHPQTQKSPIKNTKNDRLFLYLISYSLSWLFIPYFLPQGLITFLKPYALLVAKIVPNIVVFANNSPNPDLVLCVFAMQWLSCPFFVTLLLQRAWYLEKEKISFSKRLCFIIISFALLYSIIFLPEQIYIDPFSFSRIDRICKLLHNYLWYNFFLAFSMVCSTTLLVAALIFVLTGSRRLSDVFGRK